MLIKRAKYFVLLRYVMLKFSCLCGNFGEIVSLRTYSMVDQFQPFLLIIGDDHVIKINYLLAQVTQIQIEFYTASFARAKRKYPLWFSGEPKFTYFEFSTSSRKPDSLDGFQRYLQNETGIWFWCEAIEDYLDFSNLPYEVILKDLFACFSQEKGEVFQDVPTFLRLLIEKDLAMMTEEQVDTPFDDEVDVDDFLAALEEE